MKCEGQTVIFDFTMHIGVMRGEEAACQAQFTGDHHHKSLLIHLNIIHKPPRFSSPNIALTRHIHWRRKWQPTPVVLPGESQGWRSLVGCHLWGRTESDTTEAT